MSRSIMQDKSKHRCYICDIFCGDGSVKPYLEEHHVFGGPRRKKSEHYGLKVYLCRKHHIHAGGPEAVHRNHETCLMIQQDVQRQFEKTHTREEFMALIGRNYL